MKEIRRFRLYDMQVDPHGRRWASPFWPRLTDSDPPTHAGIANDIHPANVG
jgi:hypothetical protein